MIKYCPRCETWKERPKENFYKNPKTLDGLRSWCKSCCNEDNRKREPKYKEYRKHYAVSKKGKEVRKKALRKYRNTLKGHLKQVFNDIRQRCDNSDCQAYKNYGGRGIQNRFKSLDSFRNYVINQLQIDPRKLQIDRINNDGHYERGNIQFVTCKENLKNRRHDGT